MLKQDSGTLTGSRQSILWRGSQPWPPPLAAHLSQHGMELSRSLATAVQFPGGLSLVGPSSPVQPSRPRLTGRRLGVLASDAGAADALAQVLRDRGAEVVALSLHREALERAEALDPEVIVAEPSDFCGRGWPTAQALLAHEQLRWACFLLCDAEALQARGHRTQDVHGLCHEVLRLCGDYDQIAQRLGSQSTLELSLQRLGPYRLLRALCASGRNLRARISSRALTVEIDCAEGIVVGAHGGQGLKPDDALLGAAGLSALLAQSTGMVRVRAVDQPAVTNIMAPLDAALASARRRRSAPPAAAGPAAAPAGSASHGPAELPAASLAGKTARTLIGIPAVSAARLGSAGPVQNAAPSECDRTISIAVSLATRGANAPASAPAGAGASGGRQERAASRADEDQAPDEEPTEIQNAAMLAGQGWAQVAETAPLSEPEQGALPEPAPAPSPEAAPHALPEAAYPALLISPPLGARAESGETAAPHVEPGYAVEVEPVLASDFTPAGPGFQSNWRARVLALSRSVLSGRSRGGRRGLLVGALLGGAALTWSLWPASEKASPGADPPATSPSQPAATGSLTAAGGVQPEAQRADAPAPPSQEDEAEAGEEAAQDGTGAAARNASRLTTRGNALLRKGRLGAAKARYNAALRALPSYPRALSGLARVALRQQDGEAALQLAKKLVRARPGLASSHLLLADAHALLGNTKAARQAYIRAAKRGSKAARARLKALGDG